MQEARDKITGLIRHAIEDQAHLELVTSEGKPTPRGGYPTTFMYAQLGNATLLTIEVAWYPGSASFDLYGPAVDAADDALWTGRPEERRLRRGKQHYDHGRLQFSTFFHYSEGAKLDDLLWLVPVLLAWAPRLGVAQ